MRAVGQERSQETKMFSEKEAKFASNGFGQNQKNGTMKTGDPNKQETIDVSEEDIERVRNLYEKENLPKEFNEWSRDEQDNWLITKVRPLLKGFPESLVTLFAGAFHPLQHEKYPPKKPDWLDMEKFQRGQKILRDHFFGVMASLSMSLLMMFSFKDGVKPIISSQASSSPYSSFRRYLATGLNIKSWMESDPWDENSAAYKGVKLGRMYHQSATNKIQKLGNEKYDEITVIKNPWCPSRNVLLEDFRNTIKETSIITRPYEITEGSPKRPMTINQAEMASIQFCLMGLVLLYPKEMGFGDLKGEDMEAFCHFWRVVGYIFGVDDRYNFYDGTAEDIKRRGRDIMHYYIKQNLRNYGPEWEHLGRTLLEGIKYYFFDIPFESIVLYLTTLIDVEVPKFRSTVSYYSLFMYYLLWYTNKYLTRIPGVKFIMNNVLIYCMNRGANFSEEKHKELKMRSQKILDTLAGNM